MSATFRGCSLRRLQGAHHPDHGLASSLSRAPPAGRLALRREPCLTSSRVPRQGSSPASFRRETASSRQSVRMGLSCMAGNCHVRF